MPEGNMFVEKRKHRRIGKLLFVNYKLMPAENLIEPVKKDGQTHDLSLGGVRIEGEPVGNVGDVLRVEFLIGDGHPVTTFAEIKWIKGADENSQFGVEFMTLKHEDQKMLEEMIE